MKLPPWSTHVDTTVKLLHSNLKWSRGFNHYLGNYHWNNCREHRVEAGNQRYNQVATMKWHQLLGGYGSSTTARSEDGLPAGSQPLFLLCLWDYTNSFTQYEKRENYIKGNNFFLGAVFINFHQLEHLNIVILRWAAILYGVEKQVWTRRICPAQQWRSMVKASSEGFCTICQRRASSARH